MLAMEIPDLVISRTILTAKGAAPVLVWCVISL